MSNVLEFPAKTERESREWGKYLRDLFPSGRPADAAFADALPRVRQLMEELQPAFSVRPEYQIPGDLSEQQLVAIQAAVDHAADLMGQQLIKERVATVLAIARLEYRFSFFRMTGEDPGAV
ncbi:MAG: hypothetical protein U1F53_06750 [Burkholderiaceae bacterium]